MRRPKPNPTLAARRGGDGPDTQGEPTRLDERELKAQPAELVIEAHMEVRGVTGLIEHRLQLAEMRHQHFFRPWREALVMVGAMLRVRVPFLEFARNVRV